VGTIAENLMNGDCDARQTDMNKAIKMAGADFIYEFDSSGADAYVGAGSIINMSGGQK
jgi:ABC-type multidrug transport system fused ATPase/permease subunit